MTPELGDNKRRNWKYVIEDDSFDNIIDKYKNLDEIIQEDYDKNSEINLIN